MRITVVALIATTVGIASAVSCQSQGGICIDGRRDCPLKWRSVFWDSGCGSGYWPKKKDDKCCIPA